MLKVIGSTYSVPKELIEKVATAAFSFLKINDAEIELKFVSIPEISRLNKVYRDKEGPTDVLSFQLEEKPLLGQIFICYTFTKDQASGLGKKMNDEVALLTVHGILHIAGYDHISEAEESEMQEIESQILERVGIKR